MYRHHVWISVQTDMHTHICVCAPLYIPDLIFLHSGDLNYSILQQDMAGKLLCWLKFLKRNPKPKHCLNSYKLC